MTRNAIIMAAGMSSRFAPLSLETPKALLNVKDEIMIERQIGQLREAGIDEIVIVVGYLKEKFEYLKEKYHVILVENPYYKQMNNFSTLYVAREYLKNTWICSADNYFTENVFMEESENYAVDATKNIRAACAVVGVEYHRLLREESPLPAGSMVFATAAHAAAFLAGCSGNVLLATGAKELAAFAALGPERLFPRCCR